MSCRHMATLLPRWLHQIPMLEMHPMRRFRPRSLVTPRWSGRERTGETWCPLWSLGYCRWALYRSAGRRRRRWTRAVKDLAHRSCGAGHVWPGWICRQPVVCMFFAQSLPSLIVAYNLPPPSRYLWRSNERFGFVHKLKNLLNNISTVDIYQLRELLKRTRKHSSLGKTRNGSFFSLGLTNPCKKLKMLLSHVSTSDANQFSLSATLSWVKATLACLRIGSSIISGGLLCHVGVRCCGVGLGAGVGGEAGADGRREFGIDWGIDEDDKVVLGVRGGLGRKACMESFLLECRWSTATGAGAGFVDVVGRWSIILPYSSVDGDQCSRSEGGVKGSWPGDNNTGKKYQTTKFAMAVTEVSWDSDANCFQAVNTMIIWMLFQTWKDGSQILQTAECWRASVGPPKSTFWLGWIALQRLL